MTQPLDQQLPTYNNGANFAPIKPLLALREPNGHKSPYSRHYLADAIKAKYKEKIKDNEASWKEMVSVGQLIALFIEGKQILDWNPYTQAYTPRKLKRTDPNKIKAVNFMQYYCSNWQSKWGSSNPDIILDPLSNRDQDLAQARKANIVVNHLERKMYSSWYNYHEGLMAQVFGWYGNRVRPCNKKGQSILKPILTDQSVQIGQGWGKCHDCGYSGAQFNSVEAGDGSLPVCTECGSTGVYYEPPITQLMPQITGHERIMLPDIIAEQLPFPACRWDLRFKAEESSWFIYEQEVGLGVIRRVLGDIRVPEGEGGNEIGMEAIRNLESMGSPLGGRSDVLDDSANNRDTALITEMYLSPDDLYDIRINGDEMTVEGMSLPKGVRASELFPDGCCAIGLNGMGLLVGLYAEHHSNSVTSGVYHMKPLSGTGRGVADAVEVQKRFNRFDSQAVNAMAHTATPATLHVAGAIKETDRRLLSQSDVDIPVNLQNFPEVRSLHDLVAPMQRQIVPSDMLQYTYSHLQNFMQLAYHTTNLGGTPTPQGVQNNTATYAEIADANSESLFTPTLSLKAEVRLETAKKAFNLWIEHTPVPRFLPFERTTRAGSRGMEIKGEDVRGEYEWSWVPGSELPKNKLSRRKDMIQFYGMFGGIAGYIEAKAASPQEVSEMERIFDMDFATMDYDEVGEVCRTRFEMAKELLERSSQMREMAMMQYGVAPPVDMMALMVEVKPTMKVTEANLAQKALWFSNLLDTTEGQEATDEERDLISTFVEAHALLAKGQAIEVATAETEVGMAAQAPMMQAEMEQNAVAAEQNEQSAQAARDADVQAKQMEMEAQEASAQADHERSMEMEGVKLAGAMAQNANKNSPQKPK